MFKKITLFLALGLVFLGINANAQTTRFIASPSSSTLDVGDTLVIAVTTQDFDDVLGFGYSMNWDPTVLQLVHGVDAVVPVDIPNDFFANTALASNGIITFAWNDPNLLFGISLADDIVLYEIVRFTAISPGTSAVEFTSTPTDASIVYADGMEETPLFTNASVTVTDPNVPTTPDFECMFNNFGLAIEADSAATGEQLCLDVNMCNADSLVSFQYSINFNPAILQFDSIANINLPQPGSVFENSNNTDGWVFTFWTDTLGMGIDIPDTLAYELCFTVIGAGGEMDTVSIVNTPGIIEVTKSSNPGVNIGLEIQDGPIVVSGTGGSAITLVAADVEGSPGDTICVAVTAQNFEDVTSFQYTFNFDETSLEYLEHRNFNADLPGLSAAINDSPMFSDNGEILVVYPDPGGMPFTLMDGDTLYEVCFIIDPMATIGTNALVGFSDDPVVRGATQMAPAPLLTNDGSVTVIPDPNQGSGDFELTIGDDTAFCPDSSICVPVIVEDGFTDVSGGGFRVNFIPADLTYTGLINPNPAFAAGQVSWQTNNPPNTDRIILLMNNISTDQGGINLAPGEIAFELCFTANGSGDVTSPITVTPNTPEFVDPDFMSILPITINDGAAIIESSACPGGEVDITVTETIVNVLCNGDATGSISLDIQGGDGTFAISWTGSPTDVSGLTTPTISNLEAGTYTVSITSGTRSFTETYTITQLAALTGSTSLTNITCNGDADGTITLTPGGGVAPYTFAWSHGPTDQNLTNLPPGSYTPTITDANMCTLVLPAVTITEPEVLAITIDETNNVSCLDGNDGAISTIVTGGNGGNMYQWSGTTPPATTPDISNLTAGNYRVTVTDSEGCTAVSPNVTITQPSTAVAITIDNILPENCNGGGSIFITPTGGDNNYTYSWSGPVGSDLTTQDNEDIPTGGYVVTVTDGNGCSAISGIEVVPSTPAITIDEIITQPTCDSESNGAINLTVSGGTGDGFSFNWDPTASTQDLSNLMAGDYEVTVTDDGDGCTATAIYQLTNSTNLTISEVSSTPAGCAGATNGSLTIEVNGGSGIYTFLWDDPSGQTGTTLEDVAAGTYTVTVTDLTSSCTEEESFIIDSDGGIEITGTPTDASCNGAENGSININVTGAGNNPTFQWSANNIQTEDISNIPNDNYVVTVTSTDGQCTQTAAFTVDAGNGFDIDLDGITEATCDGADNGAVNITVTGATGTPDYDWSTGSTTEDITNAIGGTTAVVTITDQAGCVEFANYVIPSGNGFDIDLVSIDNASCGGAEDGVIDIELDGAVLPTSIEWNTTPPTSTEDLSGVPSGAYTVLITDAAGCNAMATYTVDNDGGISGAVQTATDVTCNGSMDGSITLDILNASNNLMFDWSEPEAMGPNPIGLPAKTYSVTITDMDSGCTDVIENIIIGEPEPITYTAAVEDASCNGEDDGTITITAMGGNGGFSYDWSHDAALMGNVASGLAPGSYIVTITDSRGCNVVTEGIIVNEPTAISVTGNVTNVSGAGNDGAITAIATGGSGTYTNYDWVDNNNNTLSGETINGLMPGTFDVTVTDDNGCTGTGTFTINAADAPNPTFVSVTNVTCFEGNDGAIMIDVTGGSGGYTYNWQGPTNIPNDVEDPTGLMAGTYNVTVTDNNGVSGILSSIVVGEPIELDYDLMDLISVSCPGFMDGEINISPIGGNGEPYTVAWNITPTPANQFNPVGLAAGTYTPTITDALGCTVEGRNVTVQEPDEIMITVVNLIDPSCNNGGESGSISINVEGGTEGPGYTYAWELNGSTPPTFPSTPDLTNLGSGNYNVTVTDDNGCTAVGGPYILSGINAINIQFDSVRHVRCAGIAEGAIFVTVSGGTEPFMPEWKNGQGDVINNGLDLEGLIGGSYTLCVTDAAGCSETFGPTTINEPQPITVDDIEIENAGASADDGQIRLIGVDGGTTPYTFNWEGPNNAMQSTGNVPTITDIPPGEWRVTIVDANGCTEVITDLIILGNLSVQAIETDPTCNGDDNGSIELIINGGSPEFNYEWSAFNGGGGIVPFAKDQFSLTGGSYIVTVTDDNGVVVIDTFNLVDPAPITVDFAVTNQTGADCNGFINTTVNGGTGSYSYIWNNGATSPDLFDVCKGEYDLTVADGNGCVVTTPVIFVTSGPLTFASLSTDGSSCAGGTGGSAGGAVFGGCGPYTFTLSLGGSVTEIVTSNDGSFSFTGLAAGMYEISVTDAAGSTPLDSSFEIPETVITIVADTIINNTGMGMCNGAVNITVSGGQLPYTYMWSNGATSQDVSDVCENQSPLSVVVTDANGCIIQSQQFILIRGLSVELEVSNETCAGEADGSIISSPTGGAAPYTYQWSNGETTPNITGLTPGSYIVTVTDSDNSTITASATINGSSDPISVTSEVMNPTGGNADGSIDLTVTGGTPPYDYEWSNGIFTPINAGLIPGSYTVIITDFFDCVYSETFTLAGEAISLAFEQGSDGCPGQAGNLGTLRVIPTGGAAPYTYQWDVTDQPNTTDNISGLAPGDYTVTVMDASGLTAVGTGTVDELEEIMIDLVVDEINSNIISTVTGGSAPYNYSWNDPGFSNTRDLMDVPSGTYTLVISDRNGCVNQATVELLAGPCEKVRKVISPNNDGFNDEFIVSCANRFEIELEIYNRWGQLEFMATNYSNNWVGTGLEGEQLPEGGYFYVIRYQDSEGETQQIRGSLNIVY